MKVAFYSSAYPGCGDGISTYIFQMSMALRLIGHQTVIFTNRESGCPEIEKTEGATIYRIYEKSEIRSRVAALNVLKAAENLKIDLIEGADHLGECAPLLAMPHNVPVMVKVHCSNAVRVLYESEVLYPWQRIMTRLAHMRNWRQIIAEFQSIRNADILCAPSKKLIYELKKQSFFKGRSIGFVPNPFTPFRFSRSAEQTVPTILFAGRLCFGKGISYLPKIMQKVWGVVPECRLILAGSDSYARGLGSLQTWLEKRFLDQRSHVTFAGNLSVDALTRMYDQAWLVIIPSRWDNFPSVALEAMARRKPIVASPYGGMPEMFKNTGNIIADPETEDFSNAVCSFLQDKKLRQDAGISGLQRTEDVYAPEVVAEQYVSFVNQSLQ